MVCVRAPERNKIGIIFNPKGGANRKREAQVTALLSRLGKVCKATNPFEVKMALKALAKEGRNWLIVSGGDGTVQMVLTSLFMHRPYCFMPYLAILPGGTTNLIALDVGPRGSQSAAIKRLDKVLEREQKAKTVSMQMQKRVILRVSSSRHNGRYFMFLGGGLIAEGVAFFEKSFRDRSRTPFLSVAYTLFRYLAQFLTEKAGYETMKFVLDEKERISGEVGCFMVSSLERLFWGIKPFWHYHPGKGNITVFFKKAKKFMRLLPFILSGRTNPDLTLKNGYFSSNFSKVHVFSRSALAVDGELMPPEGSESCFTIEKASELLFWKW